MSGADEEDLPTDGVIEDGAIAVIGMAGRFPGAEDLNAYWRNLRGGVESLRFFSDEELLASGTPRDLLAHPELVRAGMVLDGLSLGGIDLFDASFFGSGPADAELLDPPQRFFLQYAWHTLENAGYDPLTYGGVVGVYGGATLSMYLMRLASHPQTVAHLGGWEAGLGNATDFLATRVAYKLNLEGPAFTVQTACSTSMVAIHLACQGLLSFETDLALAGGVTIRIPHHAGYLYREGGIASPDGHTRPFDARGQGTVFGSGIGIVALKRLEDAIQDGDRVLAVVLGSAVNNDGSNKVGFTAPSLKKQADVIGEALGNADVEAETISYVEAHGTGTALGDPIEMAALTRAFDSRERGFCAVGSVKSNIGHLDIASGVASFIKTVLALQHRELPPSLNFEVPNPKIDFDGSPFFVNRELRPWESPRGPRRAGVSSFGFGGTNVHMILEEAPDVAPSTPSRPQQLLVLSAKTETALSAAATRLADRLGEVVLDETVSDVSLADAAFTLQQGRQALTYRRSLVAASAEEAVQALRSPVAPVVSDRDDPPVVFLFPGQGAQYPNMGRDLWEKEPTFRETVDLGCRLLEPQLGLDLRETLYPEPTREAEAAQSLRRTELTQPALYVLEVALARLWREWGVQPTLMLGHSVGEFAAATLAGVFSFEEGLRLVAERGKLMAAQTPGTMLAMGLGEEELSSWLGGGVELAAVNAPDATVVAGPSEAVADLARRLEEAGIESRPLHTSHAFHTAMMEPALGPFERAFQHLSLAPPAIPYLSNLSGELIRPEEATDPAYWARQMRSPVRFSAGAQRVLEDPDAILLEVGPGESLGKLTRRQGDEVRHRTILASLSPPKRRRPDHATMLSALGRLWSLNVPVDWRALSKDEGRRRVELPGYPFEGRSYWIEIPGETAFSAEGSASAEVPSATGSSATASSGEQGAVAQRENEEAPASLRGLQHQRPELSTPYVAPQGESEVELAALFETVLRVQGVGAADDFFELGGDSLMGTRLLTRLRDQYRVRVSLDQLFEDPTVKGLAAALKASSPEIASGEASSGKGSSLEEGGGEIVRVSRDQPLPLSFPQQRVWFLQQLDPELAAYNLPGALRLRGALRPSVLRTCLNELVRRHESLRTTFRIASSGAAGKGAHQVVQPVEEATRHPLDLPTVDLSALVSSNDEAAAMGALALSLLNRELGRSFDLERGPVMRVLLVRLAPEDHFALVTTHHTVSDGWSWGILSEELGALYRSASAGLPFDLPEPQLQYADFAAWQRGWLQGQVLEEELSYWREALAPLPEPLSLPTDRPRPATQSYRGRKRNFRLSESLIEKVRGLARETGTTLFMTFLAAFQAQLARWSGHRQLTVGTPVANRRHSELERVVGFFANTLVLRGDLEADPTPVELLGRVREITLGAFDHQDLPFDRLVDELQPERDLATTPLFQAMFVLQSAILDEITLDDLALTSVDLDPETAMFDLTLSLMERGKEVEGTLEYSTDLFDRTTMARFEVELRDLLGSMAGEPGRPLSQLSPLVGSARQQILVEWNDTDRSYPPGWTLGSMIGERAKRLPQGVAVVFEGEELSYSELLGRADALADHLRSLGVGPEVRVGVCLERSLELVISLLAVLRAGGAYVPLDPEYPERRLAAMVEDARVTVLLSRGSLVEVLPEHDAQQVDLDDLRLSQGRTLSGSAPQVPDGLVPDGLAYVIFTSGSTGRPKGAMNSHRGILNRLSWMQERLRLTGSDRVLQKTPFSFDVSVWEFFWPLLTGSTLVVARPGGHREPAYLARLIQEQEVTTLHFVPSMLQAFLDEEEVSGCRSVRRVVVSGEALPFDLEQRFFERLPWARLENLYGPTEAAVDVSFQAGAPAAQRRPVSIGRPVANTSLLVLDRALQPVPMGVAGELCIGGVQVGRGYLFRPGLTAERFVPNPEARKPGERLYRTGDRARFFAHGSLDFLGRLDHQVKVRGFRIELGEIEAALAEAAPLREVVVTARAGASGQPRLVAYFVPVSESPTPEALRAALAQRLPEYMVPTAFVPLEALPLTPNGKVDRKALPDPGSVTGDQPAYKAPGTREEQILASVWASVLGVERVGVHDNFFALGGDSILSIQIVSRAMQQGLEIHPRAVFQHQTIAQLAEVAKEAVTIAEQGAVTGEVALTPIQKWFFEAQHPAPDHWNQAVVLASREPLNRKALEQALAHLLEHHDALRSVFFRAPEAVSGSDEVWRQRLLSVDAEVPLEEIQLSNLAPEERASAREAAFRNAQASLSLANGPLARFVLLRGLSGEGSSEEGDQLLLVIHHLVVDGVSWRILLEDLETAYGQAVRGHSIELPPKTTPWTEWAEALGEGDEAEGESGSGESQARLFVDNLPLDLEEGANDEASLDLVELCLTEAETEILVRTLPTQLAAGVDEILLAAMASAVGAWSGREALLVDVEGHGRDLDPPGLNVTRTVGWFTELETVRFDLAGASEPAAALRAAKEGARSPLPRMGKDQPSAQILFNYLGRLDPPHLQDALFTPLDEDPGPLRAGENLRRHLFEVNALVRGGVLRLSWASSRNRHCRETAERLAQSCLESLRRIIALEKEGRRAECLTLSDLPLAGLDVAGLERLRQGVPTLEDAYPLTSVQEGMLFHALYSRGSGVYHEQLVATLRGPLDLAVFEEAWRWVVQRHGTLRTAFLWEGWDRPLQIVAQGVGEFPLATENWCLEDLLKGDPLAVPRRLEKVLEEDRAQPFDLDGAPLARLRLVKTEGADSAESTEHLFIWSFHHLILDGWSASVVLRDVFAAYRALLGGEAPQVPAPRPFRDLVAWLEGQDAEAADDYWRETLSDLEAATPLGLAPPVEDGSQERGGLSLLLTQAETASLAELGRRNQLTTSTLVAGVWALLLSRLASTSDVVFGTTLSGRPADLLGVEEMVGMFINTLPLRLPVDRSRKVLEWLGQVQERQQELSRWEGSPLSRAQGLSGIPRGEALFETLVVFENYPVDASLRQMEGELKVENPRFIERTNDPVVLVAVPGEEFLLRLGYERDRLSDTAAQRILGHVRTLLVALAGAEDSRLEEVDHFEGSQRHQILVEWNDPLVEYGEGPLLHQLVEAQAARKPSAEAVVGTSERLSFSALNQRGNQLARKLRSLGVMVGSRVGVCFERSPEMVIALLGILKAGAAYVPLDPEYPEERLTVILEDVGVEVLVTQEQLLSTLPTETRKALETRKAVCLDRDAALLAGEESSDLGLVLDPANLAYVMHTSGSTGRPKGVMISHRGVVNRLVFAPPAGHLRPGDRFLQKASLGFDVSVLEIFLPLSVGGATVLARPGGHRDPAYLAGLMAKEGVNQAIFPPSLLRLMVEEAGLASCTALHSVASSAEALPVDLQEKFFTALQADLYNRYGPTEASIAASSWKCDPEARQRIVPIGRPIAKAEILLLGPDLRPVPVGAAGELHIAGVGLARGYFARPGLTAAAFVPHPSPAVPGARVYRTGDLARFRPDGAVEFLGRRDHQVKIRGYRVELGEIETVLKGQPGVAQALVLDREDTPGIRRLVAYIVSETEAIGGPALSSGALREAVGDALPDYMVPAAVVILEAFPLTPNGKIDRRALPAPELGAAADRDGFEPPRNDRERVLAEIWGDVLGVPEVGVHDDFFELGGDSILSIRVVSRANEAGLGLSVRHLFENRTVARLAEAAVEGKIIEAEQGPVVGLVPLTPIQLRFFEHPLPNPHWVNQSVLLEVAPGLDSRVLEQALAALETHHDGLRLRFHRGDEGWSQEMLEPAEPATGESPVPVEYVDLQGLDSDGRSRAVEERAEALQGSLDLEEGPILRVAYFDAGQQISGRLLLALHHLAVDAVSWRVLLQDLETLVLQARAGDELALPAKTTSYRRWAQRLVEHASSSAFSEEVQAWEELVPRSMAPLPVDLPLSRERNTEDSVQELRVVFPREKTERLIRSIPEVYRTGVNDALLAALGLAFRKWTDQDRLHVDLEGHGRDHPFDDVEIGRTVGWFTTVYPVTVDLGEATGEDAAVKAVKEQQRQIPSGGFGYGLCRYLSPVELASGTLQKQPAPEVAFNYLGQLDRDEARSELFRLSRDPAGSARSPEGLRRYLLEINSSISEGMLELTWTYSENVHRRDTVEELASRFLEALEAIVDQAEAPEAGGYTPSDFDDVELDQESLDGILAQIDVD